MAFNCIKYTKLVRGTIHFDFRTNIPVPWNWDVVGTDVRKKMACFEPHDDYSYTLNAQERINRYCSGRSFGMRNTKIFVDPNVKTPRDIFRNSGYMITRDPLIASWYVIPALSDRQITWFMYDFIAYDNATNTLYLFDIADGDINRDRMTDSRIDEVKMEKLKDWAKGNGWQTWQNTITKKQCCDILPPFEIYKEILSTPNGKPRRYPYVSEANIPLDFPVDINVDTLDIWSRMRLSDASIFRKALINSNWREYPVTVLYFLMKECDFSEYLRNNAEQAFIDILKQVGYNRDYTIEALLENVIVQPKDWNMLQDYLVHKYELPETGGYLSDTHFSYNTGAWLRKRVLAKPLKIDKPTSCSILMDMLR